MRCRRLVAVSSLLAAAALALPAHADVLVTVDKAAQRLTVHVNGRPRFDWTVSTGRAGYDTPSGAFRVGRMARTHFSREWDDAPMPFSVFFTGRGHAIHGTGHVRALGRPASHGCVRLSVGHAATLFALVQAEGPGNTRVVVRGGDPLVAGRSREGVRPARHVVPDNGYFWGATPWFRPRPTYGQPYGYGDGGFFEGSD